MDVLRVRPSTMLLGKARQALEELVVDLGQLSYPVEIERPRPLDVDVDHPVRLDIFTPDQTDLQTVDQLRRKLGDWARRALHTRAQAGELGMNKGLAIVWSRGGARVTELFDPRKRDDGTVLINPKLADLLGIPVKVPQKLLAEALTRQLELPRPSRAPTISLLVELALAAEWAVRRAGALVENAEVSNALCSTAMMHLTAQTAALCAQDLGLAEIQDTDDPGRLSRAAGQLEMELWGAAADLAAQLGVRVW
jgi:hypothetical protein